MGPDGAGAAVRLRRHSKKFWNRLDLVGSQNNKLESFPLVGGRHKEIMFNVPPMICGVVRTSIER